MSSPYVREIGTVQDIDGRPVKVGVDHDAVTIGDYRFEHENAEQFAWLFVRACWEAAKQHDS